MKNRPEILGAADFGSREVRVMIACKLPGGDVQIVGHGVAPSEGCVSQGLIQNTAQARVALKRALHEAERAARLRVDSLVVGINGQSVETRISQGSAEIGGDPVEIHHMNTAIGAASREPHTTGRIIMANLVTREWTIDTLKVANPLGMRGQELGLRIHTARIPNVIRENIKGCVEAQGCALEDMAFLPIAAAMGCLTNEDMALGAAMIDIGYTTTAVAVYSDSRVLSTKVFDWGAYHIIRDVAAGLQITFEEAEELMMEYGIAERLVAASDDASSGGYLDAESGDSGSLSVQIKLKTAVPNASDLVEREHLEWIIYERARDLFTRIRQSIASQGYSQRLIRGIVLAGGGGLIRNNDALAEAIFNAPCRVGKPLGIEGLPQALQSPQYIGVAGLTLYGLAMREASYDARRAPSNRAPTTRIGRAIAWLKRHFF